MKGYTVKMDDRGRIQLPMALRKKLSLTAGDEICLFEMDGEIRLVPFRELLNKLIEESHKEFECGDYVTLEEVERELGLT